MKQIVFATILFASVFAHARGFYQSPVNYKVDYSHFDKGTIENVIVLKGVIRFSDDKNSALSQLAEVVGIFKANLDKENKECVERKYGICGVVPSRDGVYRL